MLIYSARKYYLILAFSLSLFLNVSCDGKNISGDEKKMNILQNKPHFEVRISAFGVKYFLRLNGVTILREYDSQAQLDTALPINHWMHPLENEISLELLPDKRGGEINPHSRVKAELWVRSAELAVQSEYKIADINFSGDKQGLAGVQLYSSETGRYSPLRNFEIDEQGDCEVLDVSFEAIDKYPGAQIYKRKLITPSSLPLWGFFQGDKLPDYGKMPDGEYYSAVDDLFGVYKKIHNALAEGSTGAIDKIIPMFSERNVETDAAFYLAPGTTEKELRVALVDAVNDSAQELVALKSDNVRITLEDNHFLVSLTRKRNAAAIGFNDSSYGGSNRFPVILRRENGKWMIAR